jgi:hypothetical protein
MPMGFTALGPGDRAIGIPHGGANTITPHHFSRGARRESFMAGCHTLQAMGAAAPLRATTGAGLHAKALPVRASGTGGATLSKSLSRI